MCCLCIPRTYIPSPDDMSVMLLWHVMHAAVCRPGTWKRVRKELKAGRLLQTFMLDVSGRMVENTPLQDDPQANSFLVRSFVDSLVRLKEKYDESARRKMHMAMWEQLADMVYEGVWLAKRLQLLLAPVPRPSNRGGGEEDEEEGEVTSQSEMAVSEAKVHKALVEMLKLLNLQDVGTVGWEAAVREHKGGSISPNMPLRQAQLQAWVEGEGNGLRDLVHRCTPELAEERLSRRVSWSTEYKQSYNRKLGNDLTSRDLFNTDLPTYLLSPVMKRCAGGLAALPWACGSGSWNIQQLQGLATCATCDQWG